MPESEQRGADNSFLRFVETAEERARAELVDYGGNSVVALSLLMRRVNKLMAVDAEQVILGPHNLTWASFRVCFALWVAGPQEPHRVAISTSMSRASVSAARKALVDKGYVTTASSPSDLRSIVMSLTPEGYRQITEIYQRHLQLTAEWLEPLSPPEQQILLGLLGKIMASPRGQIFGPGRAVNN